MTNLGPVDAGGADVTPLAVARDDLDRLVRRLRHLSPAAWRSRRAAVVALLERLADLGGTFAIWPERMLPDLPDHALADAVAVLGGDLLEVVPVVGGGDVLEPLRQAIGECLSRTS